jgi:UDP-N-acetylglucosamine 1-carboxyvinyltransferase
MGSFRIEGGRRLKGTLTPQGAKNEALQILCAVLLTSEPVVIRNVPDIVDVNKLIDLLRHMGVAVERLNDRIYRFTAKDIDIEFFLRSRVQADGRRLARKCDDRRSLVGALRSRVHPHPGGDKIGRRRLDTHFIGFQHLGAEFNYDSKEGLLPCGSAQAERRLHVAR